MIFGRILKILEQILQKLGIKKKQPLYKRVISRYLRVRPLSILLVVVMLVVVSVYFLFFFSSDVLAEWWDTNWHYRKAITITNSGSAQTDFQVKVISNYDMSSDVTNGKVQADFDDLRFADINGNALNYWIEDDTAASLDVWVKIDSIPAGINASTIYMYYGNASASAGKTTIGTSGFPALSCKAILDAGDSSGDGVYYIDPTNGNFSDKFQAYCDMTTDSGGWTLVMKIDGDNNTFNYDSAYWTNTNVYNATYPDFDTTEAKLKSYSTVSLGEILIGMKVGVTTNWLQTDLSGNSLYNLIYEGTYHSTGEGYNTWNALISTCNGGGYRSCLGGVTLEGINFYNTADCRPKGRLGISTNSNGDCNEGSADGSIGFGLYSTCACGVSTTVDMSSGCYHNCNSSFVNAFGYIFVRETNLDDYDVAVSSSVLADEEKGPGPVGYWSFDEGYGSTAQDRTSNNLDGTLYSQTASWQTEDMCVSGKCVYFNGADSTWNTVRVSDSPSLGDMSSLTVNAWIKITEQKAHQLIYKRQGGGSPAWYAYMFYVNSSNYVDFKVSNSSGAVTANAATALKLNKWYFLTGVYDGSNVQIYVDGVASDSTPPSLSGNVLDSDGTLQIGGLDGSSITHGFIDEVKIYPYARTVAQIKADYNAGKSGLSSDKGSAAGFGSPSTSSGQLSQGLVGYWKMDESSGNAVDSSGNGNTGTWYGTGSHYPAGKFGNGGGFNGTDDYVVTGASDAFDIDNKDFTFGGWLYIPTGADVNWSGIIVGSNYFNGYLLSAGRFFAGDGAPLYIGFGSSVPRDEWYYLVATHDATAKEGKVYINGAFVGSDAYTGNLPTSNHIVTIGGNASYRLNGKMDEVRIYNRALSEREVKALYEWAPGPVGYWKMDEASWSGVSGEVKDSSGYGNNGTRAGNATTYSPGKYGKAGTFDGSGDYVNMGDVIDLGETTVTLWFRSGDQEVHNGLIDFRGLSSQGHFDFNHSGDGRPLLYLAGSNYRYFNSAANNYLDDNWHFLALYIKGSEQSDITSATLSIDGNNISASSTSSGEVPGAWDDLYIGKSSYDVFNGLIDDVRIYNYARTQKQILEDMNAGRPAQKSPVGYWKFDEGYGTSAKDSSEYGNNGTITGADWTNEGKFGKALDFNGTSDYVSFSGFPKNEVYTISAWINGERGQTNGGIVHSGGGSYYRWGLSLESGNISSLNTNEVSADRWTVHAYNEENYPPGWHFVTLVDDGTTRKYYQNGIFMSEKVNSVSNLGSSQEMRVGRGGNADASYFDGLIDEVKVFNYALTEEEIKQEYNQGKVSVMGVVGGDGGGSTSSAGTAEYCVPGSSDSCDPPVAEWNFDEKTGDYAYDTSGNGNTGTLTNMEVVDWKSAGECHSGACLDFDGENEYVNLGDDSSLSPITAMTVGAWIYADDITPPNLKGILGNGIYQTYGYNMGLTTGGNVFFATESGGSEYSASTSLLTLEETWIYVVGVYDGSKNMIYIDGDLKKTKDPAALTVATQDLYIGDSHQSGMYNFNGKIDQVRIYDYARTPAQVAWDYNKGKPVAHWRFDEGQGTTLYDESDNDNDGTLELGALDQTSAGSVKVNANTAWYNGRNGKQNYSLNFDGSDDYVEIDSDDLFNIKYPMTFSAWVKTNDTVDGFNILTRSDTSYSSGTLPKIYILRTLSSGLVNFYRRTSNGSNDSNASVSGTTNIANGQWHHVVVVLEDTTAKIYVDSLFDNEGTITGDDINFTNNSVNMDRLWNGTQGWIKYGEGQIDEVKIFNYALSTLQIKTEYNMGAARLGTGE